jgi:hypothetical protein
MLGGWEQLEEMQREDFISEISELVQRQLVTQSLGGSFRNTLENMMQVTYHTSVAETFSDNTESMA